MNPLLVITPRIPFDQIRAEDVEPAVRAAIEEARRRRDAIVGGPGPRTYWNTLAALDRMTEKLDFALGVARHLESVATWPALREAFNRAEPVAMEFYASIPLDRQLWQCLTEFAGTEEARLLSGTKRRFLEKTLQEFRRHGAELDEVGKKELAEIEVELSQLATRFSQNVLDATNEYELIIRREEELAGLPETARAAARQDAIRKGVAGWRFTLQAPSYQAVMTYLDDADVRREMWTAYNRRGTQGERDNRQIMRRMLQLRERKARLVGYANFAEFALADRMAKSPERVREFLEDLRSRTQKHFEREHEELAAFRRSQDGRDELEPWDLAYWAEKRKKALFGFDGEELRPFFPAARVVRGLFEIAYRLFGLRIEPEERVAVWDPQVRCYRVSDEDGTLLGWFYADWHPRENKRGGAWMDALITGTWSEECQEPHVGAICGNLTPPVGERPALLSHEEVETVFHEFGHLLHLLLSRVEARSLAGTHVAWDFVELPSQLMENWCWERESLDLFARHFETGEPIPEDLLRRMRQARTYRAATAQMRQLGFGMLDLELHTADSTALPEDLLSYSRQLLQAFSPVVLPPGYGMLASFTHLFGDPVGYAAGYYSYKWAEVLEADIFREIRKHGIFDKATGLRLRECILSKGDSEEPAELFRRFMGRDPDPEALMERLGLGEKSE